MKKDSGTLNFKENKMANILMYKFVIVSFVISLILVSCIYEDISILAAFVTVMMIVMLILLLVLIGLGVI